jgi:hypothetical protein
MSSLAITLNAAGVQVMPGQAASFTVEVRNLGSVVDRYRCEIVGMDPGWVTVTPASLELFPAREPDERSRGDAPPTVGRFSVAVHPPRSAAATAGAWPIGAKVVSEHDPANRLVEEATITILPFGALDADLRPALMGGRFGANTVVHLTNAGNRAEAVTITGTDRAERIDFRIDKPILNLGPGETVNVKLRLSGGDVKLVGGHDTRPFTLDVRAAAYDTPPVSLSGTYERKALIPTGLPVAVATILALGMGGLAIKQAFFNGDPAASVANTTTIGASPSAAAGQSAAPAPPSQAPATPPPSAPPTPPPSAPPTATPTATPTAPPTAPPTPSPTSVGAWKNVDLNAKGIVKIDIAEAPGGITVRPWGSCSPTPCDWGVKNVATPPTTTTFDVHWSLSFVERDQHYELHADGTMAVHTHSHFTDGSGRADYDLNEVFSR